MCCSTDDVAEHIAGCNMAFRRDVLLQLGGFDPIYRAAGDDVDICWRLQDAGYTIGFSPAAVVWHFRRNTVRAYIGQQRGYGKAEALVYSKHPFRFNLFGQAKWLGRIYGDLSTALLLSRRPVIYSGVFGRGLFQTLYEPPSSLAAVPAADLRVERGRDRRWRWPASSAAAGCGCSSCRSLITWVMCINGALARADRQALPRHQGARARRAADLSRPDPARLGAAQMALQGDAGRRKRTRTASAQAMQEPRVSWRERAFYLSYWSEKGDEKEALLGGLMRFLAPQKYFVQADQGWDDWDLKIARGLWSRALGPRLHRESRRRTSGCCACAAPCGCRALRPSCCAPTRWLTAAALILDAPVWAAIVGIVGLAHGALIALPHGRVRPAHASHRRDGGAAPASDAGASQSRLAIA